MSLIIIKKKIITLKILTSFLTVLIVMIESGILIFYIKYLVKNNYPIMSIILGIMAIIIIGLIHSGSSKIDYEKFVEEVMSWERLTLKRIIIFMFKYHFYLMDKVFYFL